jgi:hypothetical protein
LTVVSGFCFLSISEFCAGLVIHCVSRLPEDDTPVPKHVAVGTYRELCFVSYILLHFINFICWLINILKLALVLPVRRIGRACCSIGRGTETSTE